MKRPLLRSIPLAVVVAAAILAWVHLRREHEVLSAAHAGLQQRAAGSPTGRASIRPPVDRPSAEARQLAATLREIEAEESALAQVKKETEDLAARMPPAAEDELITSFGKVEDMGRETGAVIRSLLLGLSDTGEVDIMKFLQVKGRLPEIRRFEDDPDEIARFQSSALRQALALSETAEAAMRPLIREAFAGMARQNLTANHGPAENPEAWMEQRSQALQQLMLGLRPHLPDSQSNATRQALTFILNLGAGFDQQYHQGDDLATMTLGVTWPHPPW